MKRAAFPLLAALLFASCSTASRPAATAAGETRIHPAGKASRVVLVSYDGLSSDMVASAVPSFGNEGFARIAHDGLWVHRVVPVTPCVTSSTHVAIITGAPPWISGIPSNHYHVPGTPPSDEASGFTTDVAVETLLDAARRQGKRVGSLAFPAIDGTTPRRTADWGINFTRPSAPSRIVQLTRDDFHSGWMPPGWHGPAARHESFSPVLRAPIVWDGGSPELRRTLELVAYDTTDDHVRNYDLLTVEDGDREVPLDGHRWFATSVRIEKNGHHSLYGSWSRILEADPALEHVTVYLGSISHTDAYPDSYREALDDAMGFLPGAPDEVSIRERLAGRAGIDAETFDDQDRRLLAHISRVAAWSIRNMPFDLLLVYDPDVDAMEHQFLVSGTRTDAPNGYRAAALAVQHNVMVAFNQAVEQIAQAVDPATTALVVTGDHGLAPADTEVRVNQVLADAGFVRFAPGGGIADDTPWAAYTSGNVAQIYRFTKPVKGDIEAVSKALAAIHTADGEAVFEQIEPRPANATANWGDLTAYTYPRFGLTIRAGGPLVKTWTFGEHGGLGVHPVFHTTLAAWGAGVGKGEVQTIRQTTIARFVSELLGIDPPNAAE